MLLTKNKVPLKIGQKLKRFPEIFCWTKNIPIIKKLGRYMATRQRIAILAATVIGIPSLPRRTIKERSAAHNPPGTRLTIPII